MATKLRNFNIKARWSPYATSTKAANLTEAWKAVYRMYPDYTKSELDKAVIVSLVP